jgi:hypothetical protein
MDLIGCAGLGDHYSVEGVAGAAVVGGALWLAGGPEITVGEAVLSCTFGAAAGYYDTLREHSGDAFRDLDTFNGMYQIYRFFGY